VNAAIPRTRGFPYLAYPGRTTRVYAAGHSPIFHADLRCQELTDVEEVRMYPLKHVVTTGSNPQTPCAHCTASPAQTVAVAIEFDGADPDAVIDTLAAAGSASPVVSEADT
jgi:hypothetical protein